MLRYGESRRATGVRAERSLLRLSERLSARKAPLSPAEGAEVIFGGTYVSQQYSLWLPLLQPLVRILKRQMLQRNACMALVALLTVIPLCAQGQDRLERRTLRFAEVEVSVLLGPKVNKSKSAEAVTGGTARRVEWASQTNCCVRAVVALTMGSKTLQVPEKQAQKIFDDAIRGPLAPGGGRRLIDEKGQWKGYPTRRVVPDGGDRFGIIAGRILMIEGTMWMLVWSLDGPQPDKDLN